MILKCLEFYTTQTNQKIVEEYRHCNDEYDKQGIANNGVKDAWVTKDGSSINITRGLQDNLPEWPCRCWKVHQFLSRNRPLHVFGSILKLQSLTNSLLKCAGFVSPRSRTNVQFNIITKSTYSHYTYLWCGVISNKHHVERECKC